MKQIKAIVMGLACLLAAGTANAQWVVSDPGNLAQGIINTVKPVSYTHLEVTLLADPRSVQI